MPMVPGESIPVVSDSDRLLRALRDKPGGASAVELASILVMDESRMLNLLRACGRKQLVTVDQTTVHRGENRKIWTVSKETKLALVG